MQIVEIVPLDRQRCRVRTDAGFAFAMYKGELRRYRLKEGGELTEASYREILKNVLCRRARERALYLLKTHDRTEQEIRRKLRDGFYPEEAIDETLDFLREYGYVNDLEYGRRYLELYGKNRSRRRIQEDLARRGIDRRQTEELLRGEEVPEMEQIRAFLRKKGYHAQQCDLKQRQRLLAALLRRGYAYEEICRVLEEDQGTEAQEERLFGE